MGDDPHLKKMTKMMIIKFDKYWRDVEKMNHIIFLGLVLNPRYKMEYFQHCFSYIYDDETTLKLLRNIKNTLRTLYKEYSDWAPIPPLPPRRTTTITDTEVPHSVPMNTASRSRNTRTNRSSGSKSSNTSGNGSSSSVRSTCIIASSSLILDVDDISLEFRRKKLSENGVSVLNQNDVDRYLSETCELTFATDDHFDILLWWKVNSPRYKILSQIARDVLAVPVSTVASEFAFSTGGRILDPFRSSLSPRMVEALICWKNWLNAQDEEFEPVVLKQYMDEIESFEDCYEVVTDDGVVISSPITTTSSNVSVTLSPGPGPTDVESAKVVYLDGEDGNEFMQVDEDEHED